MPESRGRLPTAARQPAGRSCHDVRRASASWRAPLRSRLADRTGRRLRCPRSQAAVLPPIAAASASSISGPRPERQGDPIAAIEGLQQEGLGQTRHGLEHRPEPLCPAGGGRLIRAGGEGQVWQMPSRWRHRRGPGRRRTPARSIPGSPRILPFRSPMEIAVLSTSAALATSASSKVTRECARRYDGQAAPRRSFFVVGPPRDDSPRVMTRRTASRLTRERGWRELPPDEPRRRQVPTDRPREGRRRRTFVRWSGVGSANGCAPTPASLQRFDNTCVATSVTPVISRSPGTPAIGRGLVVGYTSSSCRARCGGSTGPRPCRGRRL